MNGGRGRAQWAISEGHIAAIRPMHLIFLLTGSFQIGKFQTFHIFSNISAVKANNKVYAGLIQMILSKASNTLKTGTFR